MTDRDTSFWHAVAVVVLGLLIYVLPFSLQWVLLRRPRPAVYYEFTSVVLYWSDIGVILFLIAVALWAWRKKAKPTLEPLVVTVPLALLPVFALGSVLWAEDKVQATYIGVRLAFLFAVYLAILGLRTSERPVQLSLGACVTSQAILAMAQFVLQKDLGWQQLGEVDLNPTSGFASVIKAGDQLWLRGYGMAPHPNILGGILVVALLTLITPYVRSQGKRRFGWLAVLMTGTLGLAVSFSRAAWLGGLIGGALLLLGIAGRRAWRQRHGQAILLPALIAAVVVAGFAVWQRDLLIARLRPAASTTESRSLDERRVLAAASLRLIRDSPLTGVGAGNFSTAVEPLMRELPERLPQPVHNLPLLLSAELGLAGGVTWVWLMLAPPLLAWQRFRAGTLGLWALALTSGLVALAVIDLFDFYSWGWPQGRLLRWTYLGLWASAIDSSPR